MTCGKYKFEKLRQGSGSGAAGCSPSSQGDWAEWNFLLHQLDTLELQLLYCGPAAPTKHLQAISLCNALYFLPSPLTIKVISQVILFKHLAHLSNIQKIDCFF